MQNLLNDLRAPLMTSTLTMMMTAVSALHLVGNLVDLLKDLCLLFKHYLRTLLRGSTSSWSSHGDPWPAGGPEVPHLHSIQCSRLPILRPNLCTICNHVRTIQSGAERAEHTSSCT